MSFVVSFVELRDSSPPSKKTEKKKTIGMNMNSKHKPARDTAVDILREWKTESILPAERLSRDMPDHRLAGELVYGVARWRGTLDWMIDQLVPRPPAAALRPVLWIGLYQLFMMDNTAPYAIVNETVETARRKGGEKAARFINAVLRNALRKKQQITDQWQAAPPAIRYSHPEELVKRWQQQFGPDKTQLLLEWNNRRPQVAVLPHQESVAAFISRLAAEDIQAAPHPARPTQWVLLEGAFALTEIPGFEEGLFSIQDPATLGAVELLDPQPGDKVLDACAAPGGKTLLTAEKVGAHGSVLAADISAKRLKRVQENAQRRNITNIRTLAADATGRKDRLLEAEAPFDRILLDVPCMNTGVLRRKPDARWRFTKDRLKVCTTLQHAILDYTAALLKNGGTLVYSTCSLEPEENEQLISAWLKKNPEFSLNAAQHSFPPETASDGAFAARITRQQF